jgi:hypothetical protein
MPPERSEPPPAPAVPSAPAAPAAGEGDWLQTQLAWITNWSRYMQDQITSADPPDRDRDE